MFTLPCSLKYSSVNESVLHFHCRLKLLLACFPFAFVQVSLWKESLEGQWVCVSDVYRGQGQETQWCFCHFLALWTEKEKHFRQQEELCTECKICLTSLYLQCTTQTNLLHWKIGLWCSLASFAVWLHVQKQERTYIELRFLLRRMYMQWLCSNAKNQCLFSLRP